MDTPDILTKAADVIETRGLHQGDYVPTNSDPETAPCCTAAAIHVAAGLHPNGYAHRRFEEMAVAAIRARRLLGEYLQQDVIGWNDAPGRTAEQVTTALRACAAELEASNR